ncbi:hypothetical protein LCGC14_2357470 [marine sediment metagenome]|uniref:Glycosyl transferase family 1 domain-containing protein n=1 Tax=marine sediment metagenome TaxID=412755 RepID=A0A0F9C7Y7_9ZZZZ
MGTWKIRKGYQQLIESWFSEFREKDNVQLLIKTDKPKQAESYIKKIKKEMGINNNKGYAPILFESKVFNEKELPRFIKSVDCLIAPHCGEGFCIPPLQCMALKIPVIITNFSGCKDYANDKTATLLEPSGFILRKSMDGIPQFNSKKWAFIEVRKIQKAMRHVLNNQEQMHVKSNWAYLDVRNKFNYKVVSNLFINMIRELYG